MNYLQTLLVIKIIHTLLTAYFPYDDEDTYSKSIISITYQFCSSIEI